MTTDGRTNPASLAAIQVSLLELREQQDHQGGVLARLDACVRAHVAADERRPRMSPTAIKAWGGVAVAVVTAVQVAVTTVRMNEATAAARDQAADTARRVKTEQTEADRLREQERLLAAALERQRVQFERWAAEQQVARDRAAAHRAAEPTPRR